VTASPGGGRRGVLLQHRQRARSPNNRPILRDYKVVEDNTIRIVHDKNFIAVDSFTHEP